MGIAIIFTIFFAAGFGYFWTLIFPKVNVLTPQKYQNYAVPEPHVHWPDVLSPDDITRFWPFLVGNNPLIPMKVGIKISPREVSVLDSLHVPFNRKTHLKHKIILREDTGDKIPWSVIESIELDLWFPDIENWQVLMGQRLYLLKIVHGPYMNELQYQKSAGTYTALVFIAPEEASFLKHVFSSLWTKYRL